MPRSAVKTASQVAGAAPEAAAWQVTRLVASVMLAQQAWRVAQLPVPAAPPVPPPEEPPVPPPEEPPVPPPEEPPVPPPEEPPVPEAP